MDFVFGVDNGRIMAFENLGHPENRAMRIRLLGHHGNHYAAGARVTVRTKGGKTQTAEAASGG